MKQLFTITICILFTHLATAQQNKIFSCTTGEMSQKQYTKHPELLGAKAFLDSFTTAYIAQHPVPSTRSTSPTYVVPVVFHILHDAGYENVPDSFIYIEMHNWNQYMSATNPELDTVVPSFQGIIGNPQVEFRLAQIDPYGNCTNGIEHIYTQATYYGDDDDKLNAWPPDQYLNVWLMKAIQQDPSDYGILAYAYYPASVSIYYNQEIIDGILAKYFVVGGYDQSVGSHVFERSTLGHECGHWMNLEHPWGNTNSPGVACGDDGVYDTPITEGQQNIDPWTNDQCTPGVIENVQNIMNYSNYHIMFTQGQVYRMQAALNSPVSGRDSIWGQDNLIATGTDQPLTYPNPNSCASPIADFAVSQRYACTGQNLTFTDVSYNAVYQNRTWTFPADASITTSTDAAPVVNFSSPGWKQVTLQVSNSNGSSQKVKTMVYISDGSSLVAPYLETFEDTNEVNANWEVLNWDNNNTYFQSYPLGHASNGSYMLNMYHSEYDGDRDELVMPTLDLTNLTRQQETLSFDYSFATFQADLLDDSIASLSELPSTDCGNTWQRIYFNTGGYNLFNVGAIFGSYTGNSTDEYWKTVTIQIPVALITPSTTFKFELLSAQLANNFYIDNVNVGQAVNTGINTVSPSAISSLNIAPNPATDRATVVIDAATAAYITVGLYDMTGRLISTIYQGQTDVGIRKIAFDTEEISSGIYMVKVSTGSAVTQKRFVKM